MAEHLAEAAGVAAPLTKKDFTNDQTVRWCPGCGDYAILAAVQSALPQLGKKKEDFVFISGIGCAARFPYYMNTYGFHTIHGRAPALATGIRLSRPDLNVWLITGDGDSMAIGGNHFIHMLRRNVHLRVLMFNNGIYGLTKGQYSPTSKQGQITKSTPLGAPERPFNAGELAIGAGATFFARTIDTEPRIMTSIFVEADKHVGTALVEVLQNCVIFNDDAYAPISAKETREERQIILEHGKPMIFGKEKNKGIRLNGLKLEVVNLGENGVSESDLLVHDAHDPDPTLHLMLARMELPRFPVAMGVIRDVNAPTFEMTLEGQAALSAQKSKISTMDELLNSGHTWEIES